MDEIYRTKTFKYGNGVAARLPKAFGFGVGVEVIIERHGDCVVIRRAPAAPPAARSPG